MPFKLKISGTKEYKMNNLVLKMLWQWTNSILSNLKIGMQSHGQKITYEELWKKEEDHVISLNEWSTFLYIRHFSDVILKEKWQKSPDFKSFTFNFVFWTKIYQIGLIMKINLCLLPDIIVLVAGFMIY